MITKIEQAIVSRLKNGLGRMVRSVKSYSGELEDLATQVMVLPAVWVIPASRADTLPTTIPAVWKQSAYQATNFAASLPLIL